MAMSSTWVFLLSVVFLAEITDSAQSQCHTDVTDAIAGKAFILGTWPLNNATLSVTVKRGNTIRFSYLYNGKDTKTSQDKVGRLVVKVNNDISEVSLMFDKVVKEDEGQYEMEIFFMRGLLDRYGRKDGKYKLQLNVFEQAEVMHGYDGGNISRELETTTESFFLYRYDKTIATITKSGCLVSEESIVYGRLRCSSKNDRYRISINNVTQMDIGLYKIQDPMNSSRIQKWFFNISDHPTHAITGDNVVIGWFYNQPGINCTIRVIHPYEGAIMLVSSNNAAQIKSSVRHRYLYSGDVSRFYMSFTLLNVIRSDAGFYRIESLYETIIPGRKQLIVEANVTSRGRITELIDKSETDVPLHYVSTNIPNSLKADMPFFAIPVVIGVAVVILLMFGWLIRIHQKNTRSLESVQRIVLEKCDTASFATPSTIRRHLLKPPTHAERTGQWLQEHNSDQTGIVELHYGTNPASLLRDYKECSGTFSLETMVYDKPRSVFTEMIKQCDELIQASDNTISDMYYEDTEDVTEEHLFAAGNAEYSLIDDDNSQREKDPSTQVIDLYAEDKRSPRCASEATGTCNSHRNSMSGTSEESGYEIVEGVINITSEEAIKTPCI